jgi:hypothetical protein
MINKNTTPMKRLELFSKYKLNNTIFFETGTHYGDSILLALYLEFEKILSVEIDKKLYDLCSQSFNNNEKVKLFLGDSIEKMPEMLSHINSPTLFWLDAHILSGEIVFSELELIKGLKNNNHTIIIDDIPVYFNSSLDKLKEKILEINPNYKFNLEDALNEGDNSIMKNYDLVAYL